MHVITVYLRLFVELYKRGEIKLLFLNSRLLIYFFVLLNIITGVQLPEQLT